MVEGDSLEIRIDDVLYGKWFIETQSKDPSRRLLVMRYPTLAENRLCDYYRERFVEDNKDKLMSIKEAKNKAFMNRTWMPYEDEQINKLQDGIEELQTILKDHEEKGNKIAAFKGKARSVKRELHRCSQMLSHLLQKKYDIFGNTLEYIAEQKRLHNIVGIVTEDLDGNAIWRIEEFQDEIDHELIEILCASYVEREQISVANIREIARSYLWRYRWSIGKNNVISLFGRDLKDMTPPQSVLVFWSEVYDSAFESMEPPPRSVVDDDEQFDAWLDKQSKEIEKKQSASYYKVKQDFKGNEKFVVVEGYYDNEGIWRPYTQEEKNKMADMAYEQNPILIRKMQKMGAKRLAEQGGGGTPEAVLRRGYHKVLGWDKVNE